MIGLHVKSLLLNYNNSLTNIQKKITGMSIVLSYHKKYDKQVFFENNNYIVMIDGWIFNTPSYQKQAEFIY